MEKNRKKIQEGQKEVGDYSDQIKQSKNEKKNWNLRSGGGNSFDLRMINLDLPEDLISENFLLWRFVFSSAGILGQVNEKKLFNF